MDKDLMNISKIETFFNTLLDNKVSENTFFTELPPTISSSWKDMVVVDCGDSITDMGGYGKGTVMIFLYAKPLSNGAKNVSVLSSMEKKLNECINNNTSNTYIINRGNTYADYDEERNLHCNVVVLNLTIF